MTVLLSRRDSVATITLSRPEVLNALRQPEFELLGSILDALAGDPDVRVGVLTGAGDAFCAGEDLQDLSETLGTLGEPEARVHLNRLQDLTRRMRSLPFPLIAAVNGVAVGVGAELAIAADMRIAASSARIGFPEVRRGLFETNGVTWLLPRLIGSGRALRMMLDGRLRDAETCARWGLMDEVVPDEDLAGHIRSVADGIAANAPVPVRLLTSTLRRAAAMDLEEALDLEVEATLECLGTADVREGTLAFLERRAPQFEGR